MYLLDFEKPLIELEQKLAELRTISREKGGPDLLDSIHGLEARVEELRSSIYSNLTHWQRVQIARHPERPYTLDYVGALLDEWVELHGDRLYADDKAMVTGMGRWKGSRYGGEDRTVFLVGHQKGRDTKSRKLRRFGMPNPEGYRKALRVMRAAAKFGKPIIALLDTPGAYPGMEAEERGQAEAIARNLLEMSRFAVPIVVVVIGEGASGGALGIGVGDRILMMENTWYSVISPESCSSILWRSWDFKEEAASALRLTAADLKPLGVIDEIIPEPVGGAHRDPQRAFEAVGKAVTSALEALAGLPADQLLAERLEKFSRMGAWKEIAMVDSTGEA